VGKSTVGQSLANLLGWRFVDIDALIALQYGAIREIFEQQGELTFRALESQTIAEIAQQERLVISPGGGAFLDPANRALLEAQGPVVCLRATPETLLKRVGKDLGRPLLMQNAGQQLLDLLARRQTLYDSFENQLWTDGLTAEQVAQQVQAYLPWQEQVRTPDGQGYPLLVGESARLYLPHLLRQHGLPRPSLLITDSIVGPLWGEILAQRWSIPIVQLPSGEAHKTLATVSELYQAFLKHGLDRHSLVLALGGGVIGDMVGFAAATYMRGIRWVNLPTTLLAMVDASVGGKTGVDLPQGKNLVGAFWQPSMVLSDPQFLTTLPEREYRSGLAEVIKHAYIGDPGLLEFLGQRRALVQRGVQVKLDIIQRDPFEKGERAKLNLGHTFGHGIESASQYQLLHGEAIAVGLVAAAWLAQKLGLAEKILPTLESTLQQVGLPIRAVGLDNALVRRLMQGDKKKQGTELHFALPYKLGEVHTDITASEELIMAAIAYACPAQ
jgi:3-dehydroquinate synthase